MTAPESEGRRLVRCPRCQAPFEYGGSASAVPPPVPLAPIVAPVASGPAPQPPLVPRASAAKDFDDRSYDDDDDDFDDLPRRRSIRRKSSSSGGTTALVFGILAIVMMPILGPVAILLGDQALRDDPSDGNARAGMILGWIATAFLIFGFVMLIFICGIAGLTADLPNPH